MASIKKAHLNLKILGQKFHGVCVVGINTANARCSNDYGIGLLFFDKLKDLLAVEEIEFLSGRPNPFVVSTSIDIACDCGPDESTMSCYINLHRTSISAN